MNGISYGRMDGIANSHHFAKRQFAYNNNGGASSSPANSVYNFGSEWKQQRQHQQQQWHRNDKMNEFDGWPVVARDGGTVVMNGGTVNETNAASAAAHRPPPPLSPYLYDKLSGARQPLTKQVDQLLYELPQNKFSKNALCQPPEFLKVFCDVRSPQGGRAVFDCVLLGSPRPRVHWLFDDEKLKFDDVLLEDTADICRCTIKNVRPYHYGIYSILAENEVGRAISTATLLPIAYSQYH